MQKILILLCRCIICDSDIYSMTLGSLWNNYRDEMNDGLNEYNASN